MASASKSASQILIGATLGKLLNLITMVIITPVLGPEGFGNLVVVGIITGIFNVIVDVGFEQYYIVKVKLDGPEKTPEAEVKTIEDIVFYMRLYSNIILFVLQFAVSYLLAGWFLHHPADTFLRILSFSYLFAIFGKINEVRFRKRINFKNIAYAKVTSDFFSSIVKVWLVFAGFGINGWAIGVVVGVMINSLVLAFSGKYKPGSRKIEKKWWSEVFWFAKHSWLTGLGLYLQQQTHNIILKYFFPLKSIGYFQFGYSYTVDTQLGITSPQGNLIIPYISNLQHNRPQLIKSITQIIISFLMLMGPFIIAGFAFTKELILLVFGVKWVYATNIVRVFLFFILFRLCYSPLLGAITALGKMKESTILAFMNFFTIATSLLVTAYFTGSIVIYAMVFVGATMLSDIMKSSWGLKFMNISWIDILKPVLIHFFLMGFLLTGYALIGLYFPAMSNIVLLLVIAAGIVLFYGAQFVFNRNDVMMMKDKVNIMLKRKKGKTDLTMSDV
jgi:O-antigen/teichoic acid export membrane protein